MSYEVRIGVVTSQVHERILCHSLSLSVTKLHAFLGHDPRSRNWKDLPESTRQIYERVQRPTAKARIDALKTYLGEAICRNPKRIGTVIPISVGQMSPANIEDGIMIEGDESATRVVLDGLARTTAFMDLLHQDDLHHLINREISVPISLYAPPYGAKLSLDELGQLFSDFNRYAIPVPESKSIQLDMFDPYVHVVRELEKSPELQSVGGLKWGATISKTDSAFMTGAGFTKFVRICCEGQPAYAGKLSRQIKNPWLTDQTRDLAISSIREFLKMFFDAAPEQKIRAENSIMLTTHFWHALGVVCNDLFMNPTPVSRDLAIRQLGSGDWSWGNPDLQNGIGQRPENNDDAWRMNTGSRAFKWLVDYMRSTVGLQKAA